MTALVCDIGGTNTRFGLVEDGRLAAAGMASFANDGFDGFEAALAAYLDQTGTRRLEACCIALAGIATPEGAELTNRDWTIRRASIAAMTGAREIGFLNDFEALGFALLGVDRLETAPLFSAVAPSPGGGTRMVLGAGTGFNAAACYPARFGAVPHVAAAECGHTTLALEGEAEFSLQRKLAAGRGRASIERALSGNGLCEIHEWVCERSGRGTEGRSAAEIAALAVSGADPDCVAAAEQFVRLLGRVAGDLALTFLPAGGIYIAGGVCRALAPLMVSTGTLHEAFRAKGRMTPLMDTFSASLLLDDLAALGGCVEWLRVSRLADG